jgi:3-deoxy-D-manno-octulosonate 8-phosphate phosphatase (KDO 8-P phosphatase)
LVAVACIPLSFLLEGVQLTRVSRKISSLVRNRAKKIQLLLMDVDGVLTDGHIYLQSLPDGTAREMKVFSAHDGAGLKLARLAGLRTGLITGRDSAATTQRAREVGMAFIYQNRAEKLGAYGEILREAGLGDADVAYVGDDLPDLPILARVGLAVAVANAAPEVKKAAHYVTSRSGGEGAVREIVELVLKAQGKWVRAIQMARA